MSRLAVAALGLLLLGASPPAQTPGNLDIYFIDVMGGAATLVVTPERETILIDSGWPGLEDRDPKRILHVLKNVAGLDQIDHLVTTHWHTDHYGGVGGLSRLVPIGRFWDRGLPEDKIPGLDFPDGPRADDPLAVAYRAASAGKRSALRPNATLPLKGKLKAMVVASGGEVLKIAKRMKTNPLCEAAPADLPEDTSDNARSLALKFSLGAFDFLDCGDLTWNVEKELVCPWDRLGPIDVYQVTHHGMDISNNPILVKTIAPTVAIMNNGPKKGGAAATVRLLRSIPSIKASYQLHKNAATGPEDNADPALIANANPAGGQFIRVRVAPDGAAYSVQIGTDGVPRDFPTK